MVKEGPNVSKKVEESLQQERPRESQDSKEEQYQFLPQRNVSLGGNVESLGDMPVHPGKDGGKGRSSPERERHGFSGRKQRDPSETRAAHNLSRSTFRRKTRQQHQQEKKAATTIQSAWKGYQVRKEIDKMTKAATKIQATFRGHKIRKALPLSLCDRGRSDPKKKIHTRKEHTPVPEFPGCFQQLGLTGAHTRSQSILPYNNKPGNDLTVIGDYTLLSPQMTFLEIETGCRPRKEMFTCSFLNVLVTEIEQQRYHKAAIIIQAAWRGYQVRKIIGTTIHTGKSCSKSFSISYVCEEFLRQDPILRPSSKAILTKSEFQARRHDTVLLGFVPRIRNVNVYTVVKGVPASQRPNISIQVLSPNAVVQGYQREMNMGMQGLYTLQRQGALRPSQIFVHVDLRKELKNVSSLITEKHQRPGRLRLKGVAD